MKTISDDSLVRRLNYLKRRFTNSGNWNLFPLDSDLQKLRRFENALHSQIITVEFLLFYIGFDGLSEILKRGGFGVIGFVACLLYLTFLFYTLFRLRWALESFEQFAPQSISGLEIKIAEQVEDGKASPAIS